MKKWIAWILAFAILLSFIGCGGRAPERTKTIESNLKTYHEMSDGTWECEGYIYQYRLEISGRMPKASVDSTFVYLSNLETITFEEAWKAAGLSSHTDDYFAATDAVLVEWITD